MISADLMPMVVAKPSPFKRFLVQVAGRETFVYVADAFGMMRILLESHLTIRKFHEVPRHRNADMEKKITDEDNNVVALSKRLDGWRNFYSHMKKMPKWMPLIITPKEIMVYEGRIYIQCREDFQKIALDFVESWKKAVLKTSIFVGMALAKTVPEVPIKYIGKGEYKDDLKKKEELVKKWKELEKDLNKCVKDASKTLRKRNLEESRKQITERKGKLCKEELENVKGVIQGIKGDMAKVPLEALKVEYKVEKLGEIWRKYISWEKEERRGIGREQEEERKPSKNGSKLDGEENGENGQQKDVHGHCEPSPAAEQSQREIGEILDDEEKRKEKEEDEEDEGNKGGGQTLSKKIHTKKEGGI